MRSPFSRIATLALVCAGTATAAGAQTVKVTVPKANVRSEPSEKAPILQQVTPVDQIDYRATEGDWFKVLLPPNSALGGARVEAYISKKVSKLIAASNPAAAAAPVASSTGAPAAPSAPATPAVDAHGLNVVLGSGSQSQVLTKVDIRLETAGARQNWIVNDDGRWPAIEARRPAIVVSIGDLGGIDPSTVKPQIVRLSPAATGEFVAGSSKSDRDWKADAVSANVSETSTGVWTVAVSRDLKPGEYAVVLAPSGSKAPLRMMAWSFRVK